RNELRLQDDSERVGVGNLRLQLGVATDAGVDLGGGVDFQEAVFRSSNSGQGALGRRQGGRGAPARISRTTGTDNGRLVQLAEARSANGTVVSTAHLDVRDRRPFQSELVS